MNEHSIYHKWFSLLLRHNAWMFINFRKLVIRVMRDFFFNLATLVVTFGLLDYSSVFKKMN